MQIGRRGIHEWDQETYKRLGPSLEDACYVTNIKASWLQEKYHKWKGNPHPPKRKCRPWTWLSLASACCPNCFQPAWNDDFLAPRPLLRDGKGGEGGFLPILSPTDRNVACFPFTTCLKCIEMGQQQTSYSRPERDKKHFCLFAWEAQGRFGHCYWFSGGNTLQGIEPKKVFLLS